MILDTLRYRLEEMVGTPLGERLLKIHKSESRGQKSDIKGQPKPKDRTQTAENRWQFKNQRSNLLDDHVNSGEIGKKPPYFSN